MVVFPLESVEVWFVVVEVTLPLESLFSVIVVVVVFPFGSVVAVELVVVVPPEGFVVVVMVVVPVVWVVEVGGVVPGFKGSVPLG